MSIAANNLFGRDGFFWWIGVVEDRMDPLKLGRCRVRIIGYHTDDTRILPTDDLPWSMPMQGITSAALSGKGDTPLGPLEGTWVIGFFADGKDCQQPIMMGTLGAVPQTSQACENRTKALTEISSVQRDSNGNVVRDENGNAIPITPTPTLPSSTASNAITGTLPPLNQQQVQSLMDYIAQAESSSVPGGVQNYSILNQSGAGFVGKYQMGAWVLETLGYLKPAVKPNKHRYNTELPDSTIWAGKNGVTSLEDFRANKNNCQEIAMFEMLKRNYNWALKNKLFTSDSEPGRVGGILSVAHVELAAALDIAKGIDKAVGGTTASYRYQIGAKAVSGDTGLPIQSADMASRNSSMNVPPTRSAAGPLNNPAMGNPRGYGDPNGVYPLCDYTSRQDTNKLATNSDSLEGTMQEVKEQDRVPDITTANGANGGGWEEPPSAFNAKYPYNHVKETESGHVIELDDTPNNERIHVYHKSGTFIEVDREGSVSIRTKGEKYEVSHRNDRLYVKGNMDTTIDGAKSLLVKNTLDLEIYGKTTINIYNNADVNISGDLNLRAKNINMEASQDFNFVAGNYMNYRVGGDLNYTVAGSEQHSCAGSFDADASDINLNSGTSNPFAAVNSGLDLGIDLGIDIDGFEATGLDTLPIDIASPFNGISKSLSNVLTGFTAAVGGLNVISNLVRGGGLGSIINTLGINGLSNILTKGGFPSVDSILEDAGLGGINIENALSLGGFKGLNDIIRGQGFGGLENVLQDAGIDIRDAIGNIGGELQDEIMSALRDADLLPEDALRAGDALLNSFHINGAGRIDINPAAAINSIITDPSEFESWGYFPDTAQLSKSFNLGDLTSRVIDTAYQYVLRDQGGMSKYDIVSNLKSLAVNVLDVVNEKYPNMVVNDAFRPTTDFLMDVADNNPVTKMLNIIGESASDGVSSHINSLTPFNMGQAANIHFKGLSDSEYYDAAQWIKNNVAFDQMRLEYTTLGSATPWITLTHNPEGNRDVDAVDKVVTSLNGKIIANYLVDLTSV